MITEVDICNKAIARCGGTPIDSIDGTVAQVDPLLSVEGLLCVANYALIRDVVTEDRVWSFALSRAVLDTPDPTPPPFGYGSRFPKPADALNVWRVKYDDITPTYGGDIPQPGDWRLEGNFILANSSMIFVEYIRRMDQFGDIDLFTSQFIDSLSIRLAVEIVLPLTENAQLYSALTQEYQFRLVNASGIDGNQAKSEIFRASELTRVR